MSCFTCSKYTLVFFNFIFWLSGGILLAFGIWLKVDPSIFEKLSFVKITESDQYYLQTAAILMIAIGSIVTVVGFFGCCGAIRESKCMLGLYIAFLVLITLLEVAVGVCGILMIFIYKTDVAKQLQNGMRNALQEKYGKDDLVTRTWDQIQQDFNCCGAMSPKDYIGSYWQNMTDHGNPGRVVPYTCCVHDKKVDEVNKRFFAKNYTFCQKEAARFFNSTTAGGKYEYINSKGCYGSFESFLKSSSIIIAAVGLGIAFLEVVGLILACCVCCQINKDTYSYNTYR